MASMIQKIDQFHDSRKGRFVFAAAELLVAFGFASWAVDSGEIWQHAVAAIFFVGGARNLFNAWQIDHGGRKRT